MEEKTLKIKIMAIEINKEVICLESTNNGLVQKGRIYVVQGIKKKSCCGDIVINVGVESNFNWIECSNCGQIRSNDNYYKTSRFAPIDDVEISELIEVLEKASFEV